MVGVWFLEHFYEHFYEQVDYPRLLFIVASFGSQHSSIKFEFSEIGILGNSLDGEKQKIHLSTDQAN